MNANNASPNDAECSAVQMLQDINSGLRDPKLLDKASRQQCIELLIAEGYTYPQIGQVLKCSEKTVGRDMVDIRTHNAITPTAEFAKQLIGEMLHKAMSHHDFLTRVARSGEVSVAEKIQAELGAWHILKELIERLQSLGCLPSRPREFVGDVFLHADGADANSILDDINKQIIDVESMMTESNIVTQAVKEEMKQVKAIVDEVKVSKDPKKEVPNDSATQ